MVSYESSHVDFLSRNYPLFFILLGMASGFWGIFANGMKAPEAFLGGFLLFCVGVMGLLCAIVYWNKRAAIIYNGRAGWSSGSPFQRESGAANAAFGFLGVLSFFEGAEFWLATIIGWSAMTFLMGVNHAIDLRENRNQHMYNSGAVLWFDLLMPVVMIILLALWKLGI
ncbi:MAG: hypothetical protein NT051_04435 [Candidatus Micrarchaeota archaeon]|nr:hypothetical protein [Candidatus Micrarchaeota archaeon]